MIKKILLLIIVIAVIGLSANAYFAKREKERQAEALRLQQAERSEQSITIIEGWRLTDVVADLVQEGVATEAELSSALEIGNWRDQYDFLSDSDVKSLEGFLFPDTYKIFTDATAEDVIAKLLDEFDAKVTAKMRQDLREQNRSLLEAVILASIIEREISNKPAFDSDRRMVAGIFWNRIKIGMGLQSDATVNYATGKSLTRPSLKDLEIDSPYNTYKYRGLPPGPINNPSLASIMAVIYPTPSDNFYFLTDDSGKAYFGKTYAEHQENIRKYLD